MKFNEIYENYDSFKSDYVLFLGDGYDDVELSYIYFLLTYRYYGQTISFRDVDIFKARFWLTFQIKTPILLERKNIQDGIMKLTDKELFNNGMVITNQTIAPNQQTTSDDVFEPLNYVSNQTGQKFGISKLKGLLGKYGSITDSYIEEYIDIYDVLFMQLFTARGKTYWKWED